MLRKWSISKDREGERYRGGQFKGGRMVNVIRGGKFNGGSGHVMEMARLRENGHVTEVVSSMEGTWSCYRGGQFNGERKVILLRWPI